MSEVACVEFPSASDTFQKGTLGRLGHLRLAIITSQPTIIRIRALEGQRDESVGAAMDAQLRQRFSILPCAFPFVCPLRHVRRLIMSRPATGEQSRFLVAGISPQAPTALSRACAGDLENIWCLHADRERAVASQTHISMAVPGELLRRGLLGREHRCRYRFGVAPMARLAAGGIRRNL